MNTELHELFLNELADMYRAEKQLTKALPRLAKAAENDELREAFEADLVQTENHPARLEQAFESLSERSKSKTCRAREGILDEGSEGRNLPWGEWWRGRRRGDHCR